MRKIILLWCYLIFSISTSHQLAGGELLLKFHLPRLETTWLQISSISSFVWPQRHNSKNSITRTNFESGESYEVPAVSFSFFYYFIYLCIFIQGRWQPTQSQLIQIYSVDWTDVYDTQHRTQNRTSKPLKYQRTTNTTATLVVKYW